MSVFIKEIVDLSQSVVAVLDSLCWFELFIFGMIDIVISLEFFIGFTHKLTSIFNRAARMNKVNVDLLIFLIFVFIRFGLLLEVISCLLRSVEIHGSWVIRQKSHSLFIAVNWLVCLIDVLIFAALGWLVGIFVFFYDWLIERWQPTWLWLSDQNLLFEHFLWPFDSLPFLHLSIVLPADLLPLFDFF